MLKHNSLILLGIFISLSVFPQISGRTVDSQTGIGLDGTTIISGTGLYFTSDRDGYFFVPDTSGTIKSLVFSFMGYKTSTIHVSGKASGIIITLEPEIQIIEEIMVRISGFPVTNTQATGAVNILSQNNLRIRNNIVPNDALNQIPGIYMSGGGYNTNRIVIRGIGSRSPYSSNRIRAYLDDIPLTTGEGITNIEDIDMAAIGRVEILKGPASALYGSGLGGVIRLWSFQPENEGFSAELNTEAASFGTYRTSLRAGFKTLNGSYSIVYSNSISEGFRQNSNYARNSLLLNSSRSLNNTGLKFTLLYTGVEAQIPSSVNLSSFTTNPALAAPNWLAINGFEKYKKLLLAVSAESKLNISISNNIYVSASYSDPYESRPFNILDENSSSIGLKDYVRFAKGEIEVLAGGDAYFESFRWKIYESLSGKQGGLIANNLETRYYLNTFALSRYKSGKKFIAELGVNLNILNYSLNDLYPADSIDLSGNYSYKPIFSPRIGLSYMLAPHLNLHASIGHGFSAPSLEETLLPDGQVNTSLKPESGWNFEIGVRGKAPDILNYDISIYHIALDNLLVTKRITEDIFTGVNAGQTSHTGIESSLFLNLVSPGMSKNLSLSLTTTFTASNNRFKDFPDNNNNYSGNLLPGIPAIMLNNDMQIKLLKFMELRIFHKFVGKQFLNDANTKNYESWNVTDWRIEYTGKIGARQHLVRVYGGMKNVFNRNYAGMVLVNAPSFGTTDPRYYYPGLPRNYFMGILIQFKRARS